MTQPWAPPAEPAKLSGSLALPPAFLREALTDERSQGVRALESVPRPNPSLGMRVPLARRARLRSTKFLAQGLRRSWEHVDRT